MNKNSVHSNQLTFFSFGSFLPSPSLGWISFDGADVLVNPVRSLSGDRDKSPGNGTDHVMSS